MGKQPKVGASLITTFLFGVTPQVHAFWTIDDEAQRTQELVNFTKNLASSAARPSRRPFRPWLGRATAIALVAT